MRPEKQLLVDEIKDNIQKFGPSFIVTQYNSLTAGLANDFRRDISEKGGGFTVVKKRVFAKAADSLGVNWDADQLAGHIAIVHVGEDAIGATKAFCSFNKDNGELFSILGGFIEGQQCSSEEVVALSKLPGKDEMRAQLLALLQAPMAQTVATMDAIVASIVYCIDNKLKQSGSV